MLALFVSNALASAVVEIGWKGDSATLYTVPPAGFHVSPDAFADLQLSWPDHELTLSAPGLEAAAGLRIPDLRGATVTGEIGLSICDDAGTVCKRETIGFFGPVPADKKGRVQLLAKAAAPKVEEAFHREANPSAAAEVAFAKAATGGSLVLLDFGAVWCPPCNQLVADVLHAPDAASVLKGYVLVPVDVDDPGSWALKDRYAVTGYPTVIAANADGSEVGRVLGYDTRDKFIRWLEDNQSGGLAARAGRDPSTVPPADAAQTALDLVRLDRDAATWLARAATAPDDPTFRRARLVAKPTSEDARWLAEHGVAASLWARDAADLVEGDPALAAVLREALARDTTGDALTATDRLDVLAGLAVDPALAKATYASAAAALRSWFTGDPAHDRSQYTWYADLLEEAGDVDGAVAFLDEASRVYPDEMTFSHAAGRMLARAGRHDEALVHLDAAYAVAWGDNKLRVATARAEVLIALGRGAEAKTFAESVLALFPEPPAGVEVRTTRYRAQLSKAVADVPTASVAAP